MHLRKSRPLELVSFHSPIREAAIIRIAEDPKEQTMLVTKENWPEVKKDLEAGVARMRLSEDGNTVWVTTESFNGYDFPIRFIRKLGKDGELPASLTAH